ncbi:hypothetical protein G6F46_015636 [Rhizopus delemar]|nr:hypothetical protein G6F46_015636 [Rhizopus delemar]
MGYLPKLRGRVRTASVSRPEHPRQLAAGPAERETLRRALRRHYRAVPGVRDAAAPARRHLVGRRAEDAAGGARTDAAARTAAAG